jgi:hypothetical protein
MIYECPSKHICFSKDKLTSCGMSSCRKQTVNVSLENINWFYKIDKNGLCINRDDLHFIIEDPNMPDDVKKKIRKIFFSNIRDK